MNLETFAKDDCERERASDHLPTSFQKTAIYLDIQFHRIDD
jgi:hypothetical protein